MALVGGKERKKGEGGEGEREREGGGGRCSTPFSKSVPLRFNKEGIVCVLAYIRTDTVV